MNTSNSIVTGVVTKEPQRLGTYPSPSEPRNDKDIVFDRELSVPENIMADDLYALLKSARHNGSIRSWRCEVKTFNSFDTLVGFKKNGEDPVIIQMHTSTKDKLGSGTYGDVYESSHLLRNADGWWGVPEGHEYKRVMKVQENSDNGLSEIEFHLEQGGTLGAGSYENFLYLDQMRLPGCCLMKYFEDESWPLQERFECALAMVKQAQAFVAGGKVHIDLKPSNMLYDRDKKEIYFIDNAHVQDLVAPTEAEIADPMGTPLFISPEQFWQKKYTEKSMVYSLGITLLNLFSENPSKFEVVKSGAFTPDQVAAIDPAKFLPKLRGPNYSSFCNSLKDFLTEMVLKSDVARPDLNCCVTTLQYYAKWYKSIEEIDCKIQSNVEQIRQLELQVNHLIKQREQADNLEADLIWSQSRFVQDIEQKDAEIQLKKDLIQNMQQKQNNLKEEFDKENQAKQKEIEKLQEQTIHLQHIAEQKKSESKAANRKVQALTDEVTEMKGRIIEAEKQTDIVNEAYRKAEEGRTKAEEINSKYQFELDKEKKDRQAALDNLSLVKCEKNKLDETTKTQTRKVEELTSKLSESLKAPVDKLKTYASNRDGLDPAAFCDKLPGVLEAQLSDFRRMECLNDLAKIIYCNGPDGKQRYTHKSSLLRSLSLYPRRLVDFTQTQRMHLKAVINEAKLLAEKMLNGNDESKRMACHFLNKGFATRVQDTDVLSNDNGWAETLLASTPGIAKYQLTLADAANFGARESALTVHLKDGRQGDPVKSKQLTDFMMSLEQDDEVKAADRMLQMLAIETPYGELCALEHEFLTILSRTNAYTRGEQDSVARLAGSMLQSLTGEKHIRQDIHSPSATKMRHIRLLRCAYDLALTKLIDAKEEKLSPLEVKALAGSRLVNFSPAQYQHELQGFRNDLKYKVTTLLESEKNFATYKDYLHENFAAKFSVS